VIRSCGKDPKGPGSNFRKFEHDPFGSKTPRDVVDKLNRETLKALQTPKQRERLAALGLDSMVMTPGEFDVHVQKEIAVNSALVRAIGIKPE
jgi:tripartite-type tricarboxylate transporter receptor subunit TctC